MPEPRFEIRFWGVRGSIPTPGPGTVRYGGNTTCIAVQCDDRCIVIDAGSGIRLLGDALVRGDEPVHVTLLLSHLHWDHIQGLPFFAPAYEPGNIIEVYSDHRVDRDVAAVLQGQMAQPTFPVSHEAMGAEFRFHEVPPRGHVDLGEGTRISAAPLNHPGGATAWRIDHAGRAYVHASDHEHGAEGAHEALLELARGADILTYDATYTEDEYHGRAGHGSTVGWGHSTWEEACRVADEAGVGRLVLFHHDPSHDDDTLDAIGAQAAARRPGTVVAREGMVIDVLQNRVLG